MIGLLQRQDWKLGHKAICRDAILRSDDQIEAECEAIWERIGEGTSPSKKESRLIEKMQYCRLRGNTPPDLDSFCEHLMQNPHEFPFEPEPKRDESANEY